MNHYLFAAKSFDFDRVKERPRLRWLGVLWVLLGLGAIAAAFTATVATMLVFGVLLIVAGIAQLTHAWSLFSTDRFWEVLTGLIYLLVGGILVVDPVNGAIGLTFLIALFLFLRGFVQLVMAASRRRFGSSPVWHSAAGLVNLVLAILILVGLPEVGLWVIGLMVGVELLFGGIVMLFTPAIIIKENEIT